MGGKKAGHFPLSTPSVGHEGAFAGGVAGKGGEPGCLHGEHSRVAGSVAPAACGFQSLQPPTAQKMDSPETENVKN